MKKKMLLLAALFISLAGFTQTNQYKIAVIAFYNLENFYDTIHNPMVNDQEFTPAGERNYTSSNFKLKSLHLATVIAGIGTADKPATPDGPAIIGVAEVENDTVLNTLVSEPILASRHYLYIHYDSRDQRGIDVALLYNPKQFVVESSRAIQVHFPNSRKFFTRDILWVKGKLDGETIHIYVNHWPSRLGGEEQSAPFRNLAAKICKKHIDSIALADGLQKVIIMGDFNDDPISKSITDVLGAKGDIKEVKKGGIYNPWMSLYKKGIGTLAYQDSWGLFDQIMMTQLWLDKKQSGYFFYTPHVYNKEFMIENTGAFSGYPMRTYTGTIFRGGYSDHFPTYIVLLKKL